MRKPSKPADSVTKKIVVKIQLSTETLIDLAELGLHPREWIVEGVDSWKNNNGVDIYLSAEMGSDEK